MRKYSCTDFNLPSIHPGVYKIGFTMQLLYIDHLFIELPENTLYIVIHVVIEVLNYLNIAQAGPNHNPTLNQTTCSHVALPCRGNRLKA